MDGLPVIHRQFKFICIAVFNLFYAVQLNLGTLGRIIDQGAIEVCLHGCPLHFFCRIWLNHTPVKERP